MAKSTRSPVQAAGGIVIRNGRKPLVAVVQRRKDDGWVLPKGKLKPNEKPLAAAKREVIEETGHDVRVHEFLGVISYLGGSGPKIAHFWRMQASGDPTGKLMSDIKAVEWLSLKKAIERLTLPHEKFFLRNVGRKALKRMQEAALAKEAGKKPHPLAEIQPVHVQAAPLMETKAKPSRWGVLSHFSRRWQAAIGRTK
jgi:8-oxo-dGTP diphosphatase